MPIKLIKDPVNGNLIFSKFEEYFFHHPLVNRLHNILQNSMVYRVYPSVKTSRFAHSIGVMDIASSILKYGIANSKPITVNKYITSKKNLLKRSIFSRDVYPGMYLENIKELFSDNNDTVFTDLVDYASTFFGEEFVSHVSINNAQLCSNKEHLVVYLILQEAVRIFALTHDIGHLPLSHLTEFSIEHLNNRIQTNDHIHSTNEKYIKNKLKTITSSKKQIHEVIGLNIIRYLFEKYKQTISLDAELKKTEICSSLVYCHLIYKCLEIMKKGSERSFGSLYNIVSGDIDADRMDFIRRDGLSSGLIPQTGDTDRIVKMFCLCEIPENIDSSDKFKFLPALQSLNDIQEILYDRFRIYKYMVNHHKVKKLDFAVLHSVELLMMKEIEECQDIGSSPTLGTNRLIDIIKIGCEILRKDSDYERKTHLYLQLTDNWLTSVLNEQYIGLLRSPKDLEGDQYTLFLLFSEIFAGIKNFDSLWKRDYEYKEFLDKYFSTLFHEELLNKAKSLIANGFREDYQHIYLDETGELVVRFYHLIQTITYNNRFWSQSLQKHLFDHGINALVSLPKLSTGISDQMLVDLKNHNNIVKIEKISRIKNIIEFEVYNTIPFFVYFDNSQDYEQPKIEEEIANFFKDYFVNKININMEKE